MTSRVGSSTSLPAHRAGLPRAPEKGSGDADPTKLVSSRVLGSVVASKDPSPRTVKAIQFNKKSVDFSVKAGVHLKKLGTPSRLTDPRQPLTPVFGPSVKELGSGEFGAVVLRAKSPSTKFAVKRLFVEKAKVGKAISELKAGVMGSKGSDYRTRYLMQRSEGMTLVSDYVPGETLQQAALESRAPKTSRERGLRMIEKLCGFFDQGIAPADLHAGNVMVNGDTVIDYGEFSMIKEGKMSRAQFWKAAMAIRDALTLTAPPSKEISAIFMEPMQPKVRNEVKPEERVAYFRKLLERCEAVLKA